MTAQTRRVSLGDRGVLAAGGPDARTFLQGIVTNDIDKVDRARSVYAALLTPQGKFLFDFIICDDGHGGLLIDTPRDRLGELAARLDFYRLRARVTLSDASDDWRVSALLGDGAARAARLVGAAGNTRRDNDMIIMVDPRLAALGVRALHRPDRSAFPEVPGASPGEYEALRMALAVPEGGRDILVGKSFALESNLDVLNGVDFEKGCYVGQELTARTRYRGTVRRRLFRVTATGGASLPEPGTPLTAGTAEIGEMRSARGSAGIALVRMDRLAEAGDAEIRAGAVALRPERPEWLDLGERR